MSFGEWHLVCRFLKAVLNLRSTLPRCSTTWNVTVEKPRSEEPFVSSSNPSVYYNWSIIQNIFLINIDLMMFEADKATIFLPDLLKQSRPGHHLERIAF